MSRFIRQTFPRVLRPMFTKAVVLAPGFRARPSALEVTRVSRPPAAQCPLRPVLEQRTLPLNGTYGTGANSVIPKNDKHSTNFRGYLNDKA